MSYCGRFAPTPSGPLHFGSLVTALASWLDARHHQGQWLLRVDDLDPPRQQPGAAKTILYQLESFGLHWDGTPLYQSQRNPAYQDAVDQLLDQGQAFYCTLSRRQLKAWHNVHPGPDMARPPGPDRAVRLAVADAPLCFTDRLQGQVCANLAREEGPFVIRRRDQLFSYQLACALDDRDQGITDVVRGADLLTSTLRQLRVLECLGARAPHYAHLPVILEPGGGQKISKSAGAAALDPRQKSPLLHCALDCLGAAPPESLRHAPVTELLQWARRHWTPDALPKGPDRPAPVLLQGGKV